MKKKIIVIGIVVLFVGAGVVSSGNNNIKNISDIEEMDYFRSKDLRYNLMERINYLRDKDFKSDKIDNKRPISDRSLRGWSITEVVSTESTETSYNACVAYDLNGGIHVVWDDDTNYGGSGSDKDIFYKMKPSGGSWTTTEVVSMESDKDCYYSSLVIDSNGDIHVVWEDTYLTEGNIYYKMKPNGGSWTSEELVSTEDPDASAMASIIIESDGTAHVTWCSVTDDEYDIFYKNKPSGGSWTEAEAIPLEESYTPYFPILAVEPDGTLHLAWDDYSGSGIDEDIFYKNKPSGGSWSATEVVSTESSDYSYAPNLEVDSNGDVHITWDELTDYTTDVCYKKKPSGGSWTPVEFISLYEASFISDLAVETDGTVHVVWDEMDLDGDFWFTIFYKNKPSGGSWTDAEVVSTESEEDAIYPNVAVESDGTVHVVWVDMNDYSGSGSDVDIFYKNKVGENQAPDAPNIDGPSSGSAGTSYEYTFTATDPDGDAIAEFIVNWGDDTGDEIIAGPSPASASHTWDEQGTYEIKAKAKDPYGAESDWATLEVIMPRNKNAITNSVLLWLLERLTSLERFLNLV